MSVVLVTGGAGYIGSHVCKALARSGFTPVTYDNLERGYADLVRWGPLEVGCICDRARLDAVLRQYRPRAVLHFAGLINVGESATDPARYYHVNVGGSLALLDAMREHGTIPMVFSSSCAVYAPTPQPLAEDCAIGPLSAYGWSKLAVERVLADYHRAYGLRSMCLRYFNACGADPDVETGESHEPETHLIPRALMAATGELRTLDIFGNDYVTPDGTCIRDYIHVEDLATAHCLALRHLLDGGDCAAVNLGIGRGYSVREVVAAVERITGRSVDVRFASRREGDAPQLVADPALARSLLGFEPRITAIDDMVRHAWAWHTRRRA